MKRPLHLRLLFNRYLLVAFGCLAGLLLAEAGLRLIGFRLGTGSAYQPDPFCGARLVAGYRGWHTREGHVWIEINSHGFRDRERLHDKPHGVYRIAILGDSFAEALQVELGETFWSVLERRLAEHSPLDMEVEVLNFGVSGYGTAQELQMLRNYVWDYEPDLVLLLFLPGNDIRNNSRALEPDPGRPFFTLDGEQLVLDDSFLQDPERVRFQTSRWNRFKHAVVEHSRLAALIYELRHRRPDADAVDHFEPGLSMEAFREPIDDDWRSAWRITDRLIIQVAAEVQAHGPQFVVAVANNGVEVNPDESARTPILEELNVPDLLYPERRIEALGVEHGFPVIRLSEPMLTYAQRHNVYLHGFSNTRMGTGHWNVTGHRVAGEVIAEQMVERELLKTESRRESTHNN